MTDAVFENGVILFTSSSSDNFLPPISVSD